MQMVTLSQASRDKLKKQCECWSSGQAEPLHIGEPTILLSTRHNGTFPLEMYLKPGI